MKNDEATRKVLFVDDEELVTEGLERVFCGEDFTTLTAFSAEEAISILENESVSVIVSDEHMPGLSGSQLLALARRRYPDTIRLLLTGYATVDSAVRAINEGEIYRFFVNPCDFTMLKDVVLEALESARALATSRSLEKTVKTQALLVQQLQRRCLDLEQRLELYERDSH
jgi:DNA-binding NtrC family response regulator